MSETQTYALLGMGNPLLDITYKCDLDFLKKYCLNANDAILVSEKQSGLYEEVVSKFKCEKSAGGATLNTVRVFAALEKLINKSSSPRSSYIGCIGQDKDGEELKTLCQKSNIQSLMCESDTTPTGTCLVGVDGHNRTLCTKLGASEKFDEKFMENVIVQDTISKTQLFYGAGFFLTVSPKSVERVATHAADMDKIYATNLSAPFLVEFFKEPMLRTIELSDYVFGNETEFKVFGKVHQTLLGLDSDASLKDIACKVAKLPKKNDKRKRCVVITQGADDTIVAVAEADSKDVSVNSYPIKKLTAAQIVDTNTAGDAFVGGFLFGVSAKSSIEKCIELANFAASHVIQRSGCDTSFESPPTIE